MNQQTNKSVTTADNTVLQLNPSSASSLEPVKLARAKVNCLGAQEVKALNSLCSFKLETNISLRHNIP